MAVIPVRSGREVSMNGALGPTGFAHRPNAVTAASAAPPRSDGSGRHCEGLPLRGPLVPSLRGRRPCKVPLLRGPLVPLLRGPLVPSLRGRRPCKVPPLREPLVPSLRGRRPCKVPPLREPLVPSLRGRRPWQSSTSMGCHASMARSDCRRWSPRGFAPRDDGHGALPLAMTATGLCPSR